MSIPDLGLTGLLLAYAALAALLISIYLFSNWNLWIKAGVTLLVGLFYYASYVSLPPLMGWPTDHNLPKQFRLIAFSIDEDNGIYIWANDLKHGVRLSTPRAYVLPYDKTLHLNVEIAGAKIRRGGEIIGEIQHSNRRAGTPNSEKNTMESGKITVNFLDAPEALIPETN